MLSTLERPASLSSRVTDRLRDAIVSGSVAPGDAISEVAFAEKLGGVSRVPVHEALIELERNGLVEFDQRRRLHVPVLTAKDYSEIYEMRLAWSPWRPVYSRSVRMQKPSRLWNSTSLPPPG